MEKCDGLGETQISTNKIQLILSYFLIRVLSKFPFKIFIKKLFLKGRVTNEMDMKTSGRCQRKYNKFEISQDYRDTENMNYRVISL